MASQYRSGHGSSSRITPPYGYWFAELDGADGLNDLRQTVFRGHANRSFWNVANSLPSLSAQALGLLSAMRAAIRIKDQAARAGAFNRRQHQILCQEG
jgi:hypothetical protein